MRTPAGINFPQSVAPEEGTRRGTGPGMPKERRKPSKMTAC